MGTLHLPFYDKKSAKAFKKYMANPWIAKVCWDDEWNDYHWDAGDFGLLYSDDDMGMYLDEVAKKKKKDFDIRPYVKEMLKPTVEWASDQLELKYDLSSLNLVRESLGMKPLSKKGKLNPAQKTFSHIRDLLIENKFKISSSELLIIKKVRKDWFYKTSTSLINIPGKYFGKNINYGEIFFIPSKSINLEVLERIQELNFIDADSYDKGHFSFFFQPASSSEMKMPFVISPKKRTQNRERKLDPKELHEAAIEGDMKAIITLLKDGVKVDAKNEIGATSLHLASEGGHLNVVKLLIEKEGRVNVRDSYGDTPLHLASRIGHLNMVKFLIAEGAKVNAQTNSGDTPLHEASSSLYKPREYSYLNVVKFLIAKGGKINARNKDGDTPLHEACRICDLQVIKFLVAKGAKIDARNKNGNTPLHKAGRSSLAVKTLLKNGGKINVKNIYGWTALHFASSEGLWEMVGFLLKNGAKVNIQDNCQVTPLHLASEEALPNTVKTLIENKAKVDAQDEEDQTPLHLVSKRRFVTPKGVENGMAVAGLLIENKASITIKDNKGKTPFDLAKKNPNKKLLKLFEKK